jgi:biotin carboxylase
MSGEAAVVDDRFRGHNLLLLGSNVGSVDIIRYAQAGGAKVCVTDYLPVDRSLAKSIADDYDSISTADLDALSHLIEERGFTAVLAGISEFNLVRALALAEQHGFPFFCTSEQWDAVQTKDSFREACRLAGVPHPRTWDLETQWQEIRFPVMVKPVDATSSTGVHLCRTDAELRCSVDDAKARSASGRVIVEEFVEGEEFTAHYTIAGGRSVLSCVDNRYPVRVNEGDPTTVPVARIYPSTFTDDFISQVDPGMKRLWAGLGLDDCVVFVQGIRNRETGRFAVFEAGLRPAGEMTYRFVERVNGVNPLHLLVDRVLLGRADYDLTREDPYFGGKSCAVVSLVGLGGRVGRIAGLEEAVANTPSVIDYESRYPVGRIVPTGNTLHQLMIRFAMVAANREELAQDIGYLNSAVQVLDDQGANMVARFDPGRLLVS